MAEAGERAEWVKRPAARLLQSGPRHARLATQIGGENHFLLLQSPPGRAQGT